MTNGTGFGWRGNVAGAKPRGMTEKETGAGTVTFAGERWMC